MKTQMDAIFPHHIVFLFGIVIVATLLIGCGKRDGGRRGNSDNDNDSNNDSNNDASRCWGNLCISRNRLWQRRRVNLRSRYRCLPSATERTQLRRGGIETGIQGSCATPP